MTQWISVKDELPNDDVFVLVYGKDLRPTTRAIGWYSTFSEVWFAPGHPYPEISHWCKMPKPPESKND